MSDEMFPKKIQPLLIWKRFSKSLVVEKQIAPRNLVRCLSDAAWQGHSFRWFYDTPSPNVKLWKSLGDDTKSKLSWLLSKRTVPNNVALKTVCNIIGCFKGDNSSQCQSDAAWQGHSFDGFGRPCCQMSSFEKKNLVMPPNASFDDMPPNRMVPKHVGLKTCVQNQWLLRFRSLYLLKREPGVSLSNLRGWSFHQIV